MVMVMPYGKTIHIKRVQNIEVETKLSVARQRLLFQRSGVNKHSKKGKRAVLTHIFK